MGLPAPTWVAKDGKVQAAVREALGEQRKLIETDSLVVDSQLDRPHGLQGTAYVDIYLRHQLKGGYDSKENRASIKEEQHRLLHKLTAADFSTIHVFVNAAALVGYLAHIFHEI